MWLFRHIFDFWRVFGSLHGDAVAFGSMLSVVVSCFELRASSFELRASSFERCDQPCSKILRTSSDTKCLLQRGGKYCEFPAFVLENTFNIIAKPCS